MIEDRTRTMRRMYDDEQMTLREIGVRFGISAERVRQLLHADGYTPRRPQRAEQERDWYEIEVTRIQVKRVAVLSSSVREAKEEALLQVNWEDGLPMKTTHKVRKA
jgi:Sigma-70, region 4